MIGGSDAIFLLWKLSPADSQVSHQQGEIVLSRPLENDLLERMLASVIVAIGTRYVVEVERELLLLRMQILEKGSELGNIEVLDRVSDRLTKVNDQMQGMAGEVQKVLVDMRKELSRLNFGSLLRSDGETTEKSRRGRPPKSNVEDGARGRIPGTDTRPTT